jgi:2-polyprenyl-6-methoxyphenol hydroxylase-like FAD-dependent oxidoreductase
MLSAEVLIVGAGPVGLWAAFELKTAGMDVLVIDSTPGRNARDRLSKALNVNASTMEVIRSRDRILAEKFVDAGRTMLRGHFGGSETPIMLGPEVLGTRYPHGVMIPQAETELKFLEQCEVAGVRFEWGLKFVGLRQEDDRVLATAQRVRDDGQLEEESSSAQQMEASWLVGCDGTHSSVRAAAGIAFDGTPANWTAWIADFHLDNPPHGLLPHMGRNPDGGCMLLPVPGTTYYRAVGIPLAKMNGPVSQTPTFDEIKGYIRDYMGSDFGMHSPVWISRVGNASRVANSFRAGRVFIAGDAAHQFFPAGGQGMNLGIQDANNLAWKLAAARHLEHTVAERLLNSYTEERRPAAQAVLNNVQAQMAILRAREPREVALRDVWAEALRNPDLNRLWARRLNGFSDPVAPYIDNYTASLGNPDIEEPLIGTVVTHLTIDEDEDALHAAVASYRFVIVLLKTHRNILNEESLSEIAKPWKDSCRVLPRRATPSDEKWNDVDAILVRPDMRIAWVGRKSMEISNAEKSLVAVLKWWLG